MIATFKGIAFGLDRVLDDGTWMLGLVLSIYVVKNTQSRYRSELSLIFLIYATDAYAAVGDPCTGPKLTFAET